MVPAWIWNSGLDADAAGSLGEPICHSRPGLILLMSTFARATAGLHGPPQGPAHGSLHRVGAGSVQKFLALIKGRGFEAVEIVLVIMGFVFVLLFAAVVRVLGIDLGYKVLFAVIAFVIVVKTLRGW